MTTTKIHTRYYMNTGDSVPGVTTILAILDKPALVVWANRLGLEGIDSTKFKNKMADIGTIAHLLLMGHLTGKKVDLSEYSKNDIASAENCLLSYYEWEKPHKIKPVIVETPLTSDIYGFGGTPDCLAYVDDTLEILDFKTGSGIYGTSFYQISAYRQLVKEQGYEIKRARILRIGRDENEGFEDRLITSFDNEFKLFLHCLSIYNLLKVMKRKL